MKVTWVMKYPLPKCCEYVVLLRVYTENTYSLAKELNQKKKKIGHGNNAPLLPNTPSNEKHCNKTRSYVVEMGQGQKRSLSN